jgi:hypothetical protein
VSPPPRIRLHLEYFDQNDAFAVNLPVDGITIAVDDASRVDRCVLALDAPFDWQIVNETSAGYQLLNVQFVVLHNRWAGCSIDGPEPTSVHILLPSDDNAAPEHILKSDRLLHVAWGMVSRTADEVS